MRKRVMDYHNEVDNQLEKDWRSRHKNKAFLSFPDVSSTCCPNRQF